MSPFPGEESRAVVDESIDQWRAEQDDGEATTAAQQPVSFWMWLRGLLAGPTVRRLDELTGMIRYNPQAPSNYVLRGEIYMRVGEYERAAADFEQALLLAGGQFDEEDWGLLSQTLRDQAGYGLERAQRKLARRPQQTESDKTS
jgi:tetratricopeptide (TPR) repeat protein